MRERETRKKPALRDYCTVIESFPVPPTKMICDSIRGELGETNSNQESFNFLQERIKRLVPCTTDEYSRLRYTLFFLDRCLQAMSFSRPVAQKDGLVAYHLLEMYFSHDEAFRRRTLSTLEKSRGMVEKAALLGAVATHGAFLSPNEVVRTLGENWFIDACAADIVRNHHRDWDESGLLKSMRALFFDDGSADKTRTLLVDLSSELGLGLFTEKELCLLIQKYFQNKALGPALCRYAADRRAEGVLPELHRELLKYHGLQAPVMCAAFDTLGQIGDEESLDVVNRFIKERDSNRGQKLHGFFTEYAKKVGEEIIRRITSSGTVNKSGLVLVQCAFYGDVTRPGQAGGGGLATLLDTLGAKIAKTGKWGRVYTVLLFHLSEKATDARLVESSGDERHLLVRVPVDFPAHNQAQNFLVHEFEIMRAVRRAVEMHGIAPDIFHVRYSDNASRAVMRLAKLFGKTLVFTLTPDPHRNLSGREGLLRRMDAEDVLVNVNKVRIADELVNTADGIVLIGHGKKNDQIIPYFPALWLDEKIRAKPVRIIPEGIDMNLKDAGKAEEREYRALLRDHGGRFTLSEEASRGPLILNVGRLNPLKGQHLLVEAWARSKISGVYSLVLVGGNLQNPDSTERSMLDRIEKLLAVSAHLEGRFCHIGAIPNRDVRVLERGIAKDRENGPPHVYVCSSLKEEFGISILEAMSEGFLIIAPESGGVSSYITHGENGFLIDTHSAESIKEGLEKILLSRQPSHQELSLIAGRGEAFSQRNFGIDRMATELTDFYRDLQKGGQG